MFSEFVYLFIHFYHKQDVLITYKEFMRGMKNPSHKNTNLI